MYKAVPETRLPFEFIQYKILMALNEYTLNNHNIYHRYNLLKNSWDNHLPTYQKDPFNLEKLKSSEKRKRIHQTCLLRKACFYDTMQVTISGFIQKGTSIHKHVYMKK